MAPPVRAIVCGVDGLAAGREAVRQAAMLAGASGHLELVAVTPAPGHPVFLPLPDGARVALAEGERIAASLGVPATARTVLATSPAEGLARAAADAAVIVVGGHNIETSHGVGLGPVTEPLLAMAKCCVLVARRPLDRPLFDVIIAASEGAPHDPAPAAMAAHLAFEHGGEIRVVPVRAAVNAAAAIGDGLIVTGDGPEAIRLAREAMCSVLVVREQLWRDPTLSVRQR